jgi:RNA polymerase sigma-70 factor (ECF subfamily)
MPGGLTRSLASGRDADLIRRAAAGDRDAFGAIYERYRTGVYRFARLMTGSDATADDVTQEVFVTLMHTLPQYDLRRADLLTYLYGIARNVTRNRLRRERRFIPLDAAAGAADSRAGDPCAAVSHSQEIALLRRAIRQLPSRYREAIILCDVHGLSYADTARVLAVPVGTVRSRLSRARLRLAAELREQPSADRRFVSVERCIV